MTDPLYLAIDLGTSSVRAALVDGAGGIVAFANRGFEQTIARFGWAEQRPADWWAATVEAIREATSKVEAHRIAAVCACGQMHGTVLLDADGQLADDTALLWSDKRSAALASEWGAGHPFADYSMTTANPATPAWPAFKLQWLRDHRPGSYRRAATVLAPKDYINFRLTGERATDWGEASASFLVDHAAGAWSDALVSQLGLRRDLLPEIFRPEEFAGEITTEAANATGLRSGTPVLAGGGDLPMALLGSGASRPGLASDIAGTSAIATLVGARPILDPMIANVATPTGAWGSFTLIDAGGDAIRWAQRAIGADVAPETAPAGSDALFFLPFLSGERQGQSPNSRAQFFGLAASHGKAHLHRAVLEGVTYALKLQFDRIAAIGGRPERFIAAGAGGRSDLWLTIKASVYGCPILVPRTLECGVVGCAVLAACASGNAPDFDTAVARMVGIDREIAPDPRWTETYARALPVFARLREAMGPLYGELDRLLEAEGRN